MFFRAYYSIFMYITPKQESYIFNTMILIIFEDFYLLPDPYPKWSGSGWISDPDPQHCCQEKNVPFPRLSWLMCIIFFFYLDIDSLFNDNNLTGGIINFQLRRYIYNMNEKYPEKSFCFIPTDGWPLITESSPALCASLLWYTRYISIQPNCIVVVPINHNNHWLTGIIQRDTSGIKLFIYNSI